MRKVKIIIVEDEYIVAADIRESVHNIGYSLCVILKSGEEAVKRVEKDKPDLILMDIVLKGRMDGIEAARQINRRRNIPVIFLTAHADDEILKRASMVEHSGYILKPFDEEELKETISNALKK